MPKKNLSLVPKSEKKAIYRAQILVNLDVTLLQSADEFISARQDKFLVDRKNRIQKAKLDAEKNLVSGRIKIPEANKILKEAAKRDSYTRRHLVEDAIEYYLKHHTP